MRTPVRADFFRRLLFSGRALAQEPGPAPYTFGFSVRFPGRTPNEERRWLKAHGYEFSGRSWSRTDRKPSRMGYMQRVEHSARVQDRRKRAAEGRRRPGKGT